MTSRDEDRRPSRERATSSQQRASAERSEDSSQTSKKRLREADSPQKKVKKIRLESEVAKEMDIDDDEMKDDDEDNEVIEEEEYDDDEEEDNEEFGDSDSDETVEENFVDDDELHDDDENEEEEDVESSSSSSQECKPDRASPKLTRGAIKKLFAPRGKRHSTELSTLSSIKQRRLRRKRTKPQRFTPAKSSQRAMDLLKKARESVPSQRHSPSNKQNPRPSPVKMQKLGPIFHAKGPVNMAADTSITTDNQSPTKSPRVLSQSSPTKSLKSTSQGTPKRSPRGRGASSTPQSNDGETERWCAVCDNNRRLRCVKRTGFWLCRNCLVSINQSVISYIKEKLLVLYNNCQSFI